MPAIIPAVVAAWAGPAFQVAFGSGAFVTALVSAAASFVVASVLSKTLAESTGFGDAQTGRMHTIRSAIQPRRVIYGEVMVAGTLIAAATSDSLGGTPPSTVPLKLALPGAKGATSLLLSGWDQAAPVGLKTGDTFTIGTDTYTLSQAAQYVEGNSDTIPVTIPGLSVHFTPALPAALDAGTETSLTYQPPNPSRAETNAYLHMVLAYAGHEVDALGDVYFNELPATDPRFSPDGTPYYHIEKFLGTDDQLACDTIVTAFPGVWTTEHRLRGVAYMYVRLKWDATVWPQGIPNVRVVVRGKKVYDPRSPGSPPAWSNNWALCVRDYLTSSYGLGCASTEIDDASVIAAANDADDPIATGKLIGDPVQVVRSEWLTVKANPGGNIYCALGADANWQNASAHGFETGWRIRIDMANGSLIVPVDYDTNRADYPGVTFPLYTITVTSLTEFYITLTSSTAIAPSQNADVKWLFTVFKPAATEDTFQTRYTCDGTFDMSQTPLEVMQYMMTAGAGMLNFTEGKWRLLAGVFRTPSATLTEADLRDSIKLTQAPSRRDLYNAVKGTYIDPTNAWQQADFPPVVNSYYKASDGGEQITKDITLPFTTDVIRAQRIAKVGLEKSRQGMSVQFPAKLSGLKLLVGDTVYVKIDLLGWSGLNGGLGKIFMVTSWTLSPEGGVDLVLQEEASGCYDWNYGEETPIDIAPPSTLTSPFVCQPPSGLDLVETVYYQAGLGYRSRVTGYWLKSPDARLVGYEIEASSHGTDVWASWSTTATSYTVPDVPNGIYDVRVRAVNNKGAKSKWITADISVLGAVWAVTTLGLPAPVNPMISASVGANGEVTKVRLNAGYDITASAIPSGVIVFYSVTDYPNQFLIAPGTGTGPTIYVGDEEIINSGTRPILAGSTTTQLVLTTEQEPLPAYTSIYGMVWMQFGTSQWRKAIRSDTTTVYFDEPFDVAPVAGDTVQWAEIEWVEMRPVGARLGYISNGTDREVLQVGEVVQTGPTAFQISNCVRGVEGTTAINADGLMLNYYPAPGAGTEAVNFPQSAFTEPTPGNFEATVDTDILIKQGQLVSMSCCTYIEIAPGQYERSVLVPVGYAGQI